MTVGEVNDSGSAGKQVSITLYFILIFLCANEKIYLPDYVPIQDLIHKIQENEQEILQLRRYLTDCSVKVSPDRHERSYVCHLDYCSSLTSYLLVFFMLNHLTNILDILLGSSNPQ